MTSFQLKTHAGFLMIGLLFTSCVSPEESVEDSNTLRPKVDSNINAEAINANAKSNANVVEDDLGKLKGIINLPFAPEFNDYRQETIKENANSDQTPGPNAKKLTVVLRFTREDTEKFEKELQASKSGFETETEAETWFPEELRAKSDISGDGTLKGVGFNSDRFKKSPFITGSLIRIKGTDYFVLILQTQ